MDEIEETRNFTRLELIDGRRVYLRSVWQAANFSIVVFDGFQAWSRNVSTKEVVSIAKQWYIDVAEFMSSARARLSRQYPSSSYSMSTEKDANIVNLSFTIDDLWEGESMDFKLRMEGVSDWKPIVCEMLDYLVDTFDRYKEQLMEAENQFQKKLRQFAAVSEPEPSITLSLSRSGGNNPRRQPSSFPEPRLLDFSKLKPLEDRDPPPRPGCTRTHAQHLLPDTSKMASALQPPSFNLHDHEITTPTEREPSYFQSRVAAHGGVVNRSNDLTVNMVTLSPTIMRVLNSLSNSMDRSHGNGPNLNDCRDEMLDVAASDERGVKITEMRSPRREEQPQRSSVMPQTNSVSPTVSAQALRQKVTAPETSPADGARETMIWNTTSSGMKNIQEKHNDVGIFIPEKSSSNVGDQVKSKYTPEVATKKARPDEDWTSKATLADARLSRIAPDSNLRVKAGLPEQLFPPGQRANEANHEKRQDLQNTATADTEPEYSRASRRQESPVETPRKQSSVTRDCPWDKHTMDAVVTTPSPRKRETVTESYTEDDDDDDNDNDYTETEDEEEKTPVYARQKSTRSRSPGVAHQGRKRSVDDHEERQGFRFRKLNDDDLDPDFRVRTQRSQPIVNAVAVELDDYPEEVPSSGKYKPKRESFQRNLGRDSPCPTIAELLILKLGKGDKAKAKAGSCPPEKKHRLYDRDDGSLYEEENVVETKVPDTDYYDFDKDRTETLVEPDQVWAVYSEVDEMPRSYARIDQVYSVPRFKALITWLQPHQPSQEAKRLCELSGRAISCGEFEYGGQGILSEINCFSHKMVVGTVSTKVVKIFPKKAEIWALYTKMEKQSSTTSSHSGISQSRFRLVEITEDVVGFGTKPEVMVLGKVSGFHTVWKPVYKRGTLPDPDLSLFSHRVPAYSLQGRVLNGKTFRGAWDIDPAGLIP